MIGVGIVGLPNVGKSTLFNALTKKSVPAENFPFCTIDPSVGIVPVPDERLDNLAKIFNSKQKVNAIVEFVDIAGLVKGASKGDGLGNTFLSHIREVDVIAHMVRCFTDDNVIHVDGEISPIKDIETIETELCLSDIETIEKAIERLSKLVKKQEKKAIEDTEFLEKAKKHLLTNSLISTMQLQESDIKIAKEYSLLTQKDMFYVCNTSEVPNLDYIKKVKEYAKEKGKDVVVITAKSEVEIKTQEDRELLKEILPKEIDGIESLIKVAYKTLNQITFLTAGEKEARAWTCKTGSTAPMAGRSIHSDFETKFIRAEVVSYEDIANLKSMLLVKEKGLLKTVGRDYIVNDGDIINFLIG